MVQLDAVWSLCLKQIVCSWNVNLYVPNTSYMAKITEMSGINKCRNINTLCSLCRKSCTNPTWILDQKLLYSSVNLRFRSLEILIDISFSTINATFFLFFSSLTFLRCSRAISGKIPLCRGRDSVDSWLRGMCLGMPLTSIWRVLFSESFLQNIYLPLRIIK